MWLSGHEKVKNPKWIEHICNVYLLWQQDNIIIYIRIEIYSLRMVTIKIICHWPQWHISSIIFFVTAYHFLSLAGIFQGIYLYAAVSWQKRVSPILRFSFFCRYMLLGTFSTKSDWNQIGVVTGHVITSCKADKNGYVH